MPEPEKGESERDYLKRCVPFLMKEEGYTNNKQAVAICFSKYRKSGTESKSPKPQAKSQKKKLCKGHKCKLLLAHY